MGSTIIRTNELEAFYVLVANLTPTSFNVFLGDILGTATPLSDAMNQIQEWEKWDWTHTDIKNQLNANKTPQQLEDEFADMHALVTPWDRKLSHF